jgi:GT2 family glycosyltransferase
VSVIDNAGPIPARPPVTDLPTAVTRLKANSGPAGGHAEGLDQFRASGDTIAWVMDDDCVPDQRCLERLLARYDSSTSDCIVLPWWIDAATGQGAFLPAWCGFVVSRSVVERVGLPRRDLVWWTEDTEWIYWRMRQARIEVQHEQDAVVVHERVRDGGRRPVWKVYYEARNTVYYRLHVQEGSLRYRARRMLQSLSRLLAQVFADRDRRAAKLRVYCLGVVDGLFQRLGLRVPLNT